jgi:hypothetical protein
MASTSDLRAAIEQNLLFEWSIELGHATAEPIAEGETLHLKDIAVYPRAADTADIGTRAVRMIRNRLATRARRAGFSKLRVTGTRLSGAKKGRSVDVTIDLPHR